ncbi:hypothetical protein [Halochromatium glycolicum]|uniref:Uncharacterized protein n=1 Tax=Halochromatium glycolicum TaxID=85075 RepID=A0AAJ0U723_9GAMM|nr:hypothetical protein [Halochromatium glycolicum]MBK1706530.1 hypothetical protein [Halochromatium glycolicum]
MTDKTRTERQLIDSIRRAKSTDDVHPTAADADAADAQPAEAAADPDLGSGSGSGSGTAAPDAKDHATVQTTAANPAPSAGRGTQNPPGNYHSRGRVWPD